jgi:hypothetical protein
MKTMEQVKEDFKALPKSEQWGLLEKLQDELEDELELTEEFKSGIKQAKQDIAEGRGRLVKPE